MAGHRLISFRNCLVQIYKWQIWPPMGRTVFDCFPLSNISDFSLLCCHRSIKRHLNKQNHVISNLILKSAFKNDIIHSCKTRTWGLHIPSHSSDFLMLHLQATLPALGDNLWRESQLSPKIMRLGSVNPEGLRRPDCSQQLLYHRPAVDEGKELVPIVFCSANCRCSSPGDGASALHKAVPTDATFWRPEKTQTFMTIKFYILKAADL